jgi:DNA-binding response OmpR family regulator
MGDRPLVLVTDDDDSMRAFLDATLRRAGMDTILAANGREALAHLQGLPVDVVLLDMHMPVLGGLATLHEIRKSERLRTLPVILVTGSVEEADRIGGLDSGADDYLAKPVAASELVARIRAHLRVAGENGGLLEAGALTLDLARHQVLHGSAVIDLSEREFQLLHHLVRHAGEVVSRDRLLVEVWGYSFDPGSNLVDVCIRRLRKKLGPKARNETVRQAGYRIAAA